MEDLKIIYVGFRSMQLISFSYSLEFMLIEIFFQSILTRKRSIEVSCSVEEELRTVEFSD